ncbi:MAG: hypothetical protein JXX28_17315, partial [Deltaproteobacteria bacterium]|nr:hypothetical protein [Deltaproteobacteria bacterium]
MSRVTLLTALLGFGSAAHAQDTVLVHQRTLNGTVLMTGNTLGRSGATANVWDTNPPLTQLTDAPGKFHSAFTWINDRTPVTQENAAWGGYTTGDWRQNFSYARLSYPGAGTGKLLKAWLVWSGSCVQNDGAVTEDISAHIGDPITFTYPTASGSGSLFVSPDFSEEHCGEPFGDGYVNWAELTIGQDWTEGMYGAGGIPGTQNRTREGFAGWTLITVIEDPLTYPDPHQVSIYRGWVRPAYAETDPPTHVSDFCYPSDDGEEGRLLLTAVEGDARIRDDYLLFGNSTTWASKNIMWGRRNAIDNFFGSQIVDRDGDYIDGGVHFTPVDHHPWTSFDCWMEDYDTTPDDAINVDCLKDGARQGWDIANIPINDTFGEECSYVDEDVMVTDAPCNPDIFQSGDTEAWFLPMTAGDEYRVLAVALDLPSVSASVTTLVEPLADPSVYVN